MNKLFSKKNYGFTIVELLVVIVVIGVLASITIVSYTGVTQKATAVSLQSDLVNAAKQLKLFQVTSPSNNYPTANVCPNPAATEICLKSSDGNTYTYVTNNPSNPKAFSLTATNGTEAYRITNNSSPAIALNVTDPTNWMQVGTQVWARKNLDVGIMVPGTLGGNNSTNQTNDGNVEKYCYQNNPAHCETHGGLYQWNEAMNYSTTEGAQGICPTGSHIPTDTEWKILEMFLGMSPGSESGQIDALYWRGTNQGTQLKLGGISGLNLPLAGYRTTIWSFFYLSSNAYLWSSSGLGGYAWSRYLQSSNDTVHRTTDAKSASFSVRCLGN